jgi:hypothetical protein
MDDAFFQSSGVAAWNRSKEKYYNKNKIELHIMTGGQSITAEGMKL